MLSETLTNGLEHYRIGPKVRALRLKKSMGLVQLGEHTGLSPALLSKIERGQLFPTLPTLLRIALVFGVGFEHFFVEKAEGAAAHVVRKAERVRMPERPGEAAPAYFFESLDFPVTGRKMEAFYAEFPQGTGASQPHQHKGSEFLYVLKGRLAVAFEGKNVVLDEGDAVSFDSDEPHGYRCEGRGAAAAIVVVMP
jgi:quercetin dioxygenase-like cupin family protein